MYSAGGKDALIDGLEGSLDFRDGFWQGYFGKDLNVEFSLSEEAKADSLEVRFCKIKIPGYYCHLVLLFLLQLME